MFAKMAGCVGSVMGDTEHGKARVKGYRIGLKFGMGVTVYPGNES